MVARRGSLLDPPASSPIRNKVSPCLNSPSPAARSVSSLPLALAAVRLVLAMTVMPAARSAFTISTVPGMGSALPVPVRSHCSQTAGSKAMPCRANQPIDPTFQIRVSSASNTAAKGLSPHGSKRGAAMVAPGARITLSFGRALTRHAP